jgi:glutathione S-transferase
VLDALKTMGLAEGEDYTIIDADPGTKARMEVQQIGGKSMVPFLVDRDTAMYESLDIIEYLKGVEGG